MSDRITVRSKPIAGCREKVKRFVDEGWTEVYDKAPMTNPGRLSQHDLLVAAAIGAGSPSQSQMLQMWRRKEEVDRALAAIPKDADLLSDRVPWQELEALFAAFLKSKGYGISRTSKVLHKKLPGLVPLMDNEVVIGRYFKEFEGCVGSKDAEEAIGLIRAIRTEVLREKATVSRLREEVAPDLSLLRIWDILLQPRV